MNTETKYQVSMTLVEYRTKFDVLFAGLMDGTVSVPIFEAGVAGLDRIFSSSIYDADRNRTCSNVAAGT